MRSWPACRWVLLVLLLVGFLPAASSADTVTVTVSRGNVRAGPGVTHRVLTSVPQGATFSILATKQGWHQIRLDDGRNGWIAGSIVRVEQEPRGLTAVPASQPTPWPKTFRNSIGMEFMLIPAGDFMMGSTPAEIDHVVQSFGEFIRRRVEREMPQHRVQISQPFYLGKYEVTQAQWQEVMGNNPSYFTGDPNRPVERVSWDDVQEFIQKLNAKEGGAKYRLPTEAEWEYAARALSSTVYSFGDDESRLAEYAWYNRNSRMGTHPVGRLRPNAWGLYDMHGNVWEWVQDRYGRDYYEQSPTRNPQGSVVGASRVVRGGGWLVGAWNCRAAIRYYHAPVYRGYDLGFRLARSVALGP